MGGDGGQRPAQESYYGFVCQHIEREETLIDHRISWMLTSQGFLFTGVAFLSSNTIGVQTRAQLVPVLAAVGICISLLSLVGIFAAYLSITHIFQAWQARPEAKADIYPPITTHFASGLGRLLGYGLPLLFLGAWLYLLNLPMR
jgi:hypothetical protein